MTACLKCKNVSRKIDFHLTYDLAISHDYDSMSAQDVTKEMLAREK
jgi:hypothetical protein